MNIQIQTSFGKIQLKRIEEYQIESSKRTRFLTAWKFKLINEFDLLATITWTDNDSLDLKKAFYFNQVLLPLGCEVQVNSLKLALDLAKDLRDIGLLKETEWELIFRKFSSKLITDEYAAGMHYAMDRIRVYPSIERLNAAEQQALADKYMFEFKEKRVISVQEDMLKPLKLIVVAALDVFDKVMRHFSLALKNEQEITLILSQEHMQNIL